MIRANCLRWDRGPVLALLAAVAAVAPAWADGPPLVVRGELKATDPTDRVRKQSHVKVHEIELKEGEAMLAHLRSVDFDPMLRVEDAKGKVLGSNDDIGNGDSNSRLGFVAPSAGTYRLVVTSFDAGRIGEYLLEVAPLEPAGGAQTMTGELTANSPQAQGKRYQPHKVTAEPGRWYLFDLTSADFDPHLVLRDGRGQSLAEDQAGGEGKRARLVWPSGAGAPWVAQVLGAQSDAAGKYVLQWRPYRGELKVEVTAREKLHRRAAQLSARSVESYEMGNFNEGVALLREVLAVRQKLYPAARYPQGHPDLATSLNDLGTVLQSVGQHEAARDSYEQALAMRRKLYPAARYPLGHSDLATSLNDLGALLQSAGQYGAARDYLEQALAMNRKLYRAAQYPRGHADLATSLSNLGALLEATGQYEAARDYYDQALAMRRQLYPGAQYPQGHLDLANSLHNLGTLLRSAGQNEGAHGYLEQALAMRRRLYSEAKHPQGHPDLASSLSSLGLLLWSAGRHEAARDYFEQALAMRRNLYPEGQYPQGHADLAASLNNLGMLLRSVRRYEASRDYLEQALAMRRRLYPVARFPHGHPRLAGSLNNLGMLLQSAAQYEAARDYYEQALAMYRQLYPVDKYPQGHPDLAMSLNNSGMLLWSAGRYKAARDYLEQALAMQRRLYPAARYLQGHPDLATCLNNLGLLLQSAGQYEAARVHLRSGAAMYQALTRRDTVLAPEAQALDRLRSLPLTRDGSLSAGLLAGAAPAELYAEIWPTKAMLSRVLQRRHQATRAAQAGDPKVRRAWDGLALVRGQLNRLLTQPLKDATTHDKELARLTARKETLERDLAYLLPELQRGREQDQLGPTDLAGLLPDGHAFVDLVRYTHFGKGEQRTAKYLAFLLLPDRSIKLVELKEAAPIDQAVRAWREKIKVYQDTPADARAVATLVWDPIVKELPAGTKGLYLAPDGALAELPWAALPGPKAGTVLLEELAMAVVPHGPFLLEQLKYPPRHPAGKELVVGLGDVDYGPATAPAQHPALKGTAAELAKLHELAGKRPVTLLQKGEARWDQLKAWLPQARYAHLATHGFYDAKALALEQQRLQAHMKNWQLGADQEPIRAGQGARSPLAFTGLVLAGANTSAKDAIVTGEALVELPLENLRLCVLSACETGLGDLGPLAGEGVQGLPRALHLAGCPDVIASLWNVNDEATAALMAKLYDGLWREGKSPLEALRQAQLLVYRHPERIAELAERGRPTGLKTLQLPVEPATDGKRSATKLWAGFILSGAGR
jgi:tetratricopeptide (TPR) repeat protein